MASESQPRKKQRIPLELTPAEIDQLKTWAAGQGLKVAPAIRALLYRQGALQAPARKDGPRS